MVVYEPASSEQPDIMALEDDNLTTKMDHAVAMAKATSVDRRQWYGFQGICYSDRSPQ